MIKQMYSLYDVKSKFYGAIVPYHNDEDAKRGLASIFDRPDSPFARYPEDYRLFKIGAFDDNTGAFTSLKPCLFICELKSLNPHPESPKAPGPLPSEV